MAIIYCPECGKQVSDKVATCVHCGYAIQKQNEVSPEPPIVEAPYYLIKAGAYLTWIAKDLGWYSISMFALGFNYGFAQAKYKNEVFNLDALVRIYRCMEIGAMVFGLIFVLSVVLNLNKAGKELILNIKSKPANYSDPNAIPAYELWVLWVGAIIIYTILFWLSL